MACILHPECNFLHGYFRCQLPTETVNVEVKVKTMQGIHTFRRDRTCQVIKCNPWSTRHCPYPPCLENENIPRTGRETWSQVQNPTTDPATTNPITTSLYTTNPAKTGPTKHKTPESGTTQHLKLMTKEEKLIAKRKHKVMVLTQPTPSTPTSTAPAPMVATISTQTPMVRSTAESIPVTIHKLAM